MSEALGAVAYLLLIWVLALIIQRVVGKKPKKVPTPRQEQQRRDLALWEQELRQGQDQ